MTKPKNGKRLLTITFRGEKDDITSLIKLEEKVLKGDLACMVVLLRELADDLAKLVVQEVKREVE